jgi:hypothetical protein
LLEQEELERLKAKISALHSRHTKCHAVAVDHGESSTSDKRQRPSSDEDEGTSTLKHHYDNKITKLDKYNRKSLYIFNQYVWQYEVIFYI